MTNIKPAKQDLEKQIKKNLLYFKRQQELIDAKNTKVRLGEIRRNWIKLQKMGNYQSEYDRIRAGLDQSTLAKNGIPTTDHIQRRIAKLRDLGTKALGDQGIID